MKKVKYKVMIVLALLWSYAPLPVASVALVGCGGGCSFFAKVQPGHDPVVVNAERAQVLTLEAVDLLLNIEKDNREFLRSIAPGIKEAADNVRARAPGIIDGLGSVTKAYKDNRTLENKANLVTWLASAEELKNVALKNWVTAQQAVLNRSPAPLTP